MSCGLLNAMLQGAFCMYFSYRPDHSHTYYTYTWCTTLIDTWITDTIHEAGNRGKERISFRLLYAHHYTYMTLVIHEMIRKTRQDTQHDRKTKKCHTTHPKQLIFNSCLGWDSNPRPSAFLVDLFPTEQLRQLS